MLTPVIKDIRYSDKKPEEPDGKSTAPQLHHVNKCSLSKEDGIRKGYDNASQNSQSRDRIT